MIPSTLASYFSIFRELFYELVGYYEYEYNRNISNQLEYKMIKESSVVIPVYGKIDLPRYIRYLMLHPIVSRLSEIRQLAHTHLFLPGANHSRLEHSIGVMYRCSKIFEKIKSDASKRNILELSDNDLILLNIASILHDLGHPAWGHALDGITGYVVEQLLSESNVYLFSPKKLDITITTYLILKNEQLRQALKQCYIEEIKDKNEYIIDSEDKFRKIIAQIIAEEERPLFDELNDDKIIKKYHYLTTIIGAYAGRGGINADRLDWMVRDTHHVGLHEQLDHKTRSLFEEFIEKNKNDDFEISIENGEYLSISSHDFKDRMNLLRNTIYAKVYEGLERSFIDSLLTRLAYTVILVLNTIGNTIAGPTIKMRAIMGYLLMYDYLMKEYTRKILTTAGMYSHILYPQQEPTRNFIEKSAELYDIIHYLSYIIDLIKNYEERKDGMTNLYYLYIPLPALNMSFIVLTGQTFSEIMERLLGEPINESDKYKKLTYLYELIDKSRLNPIDSLDIRKLECNIQQMLNVDRLNCYLLPNYYFFRRVDDEFREKIKNVHDFYEILKNDLKYIPIIFCLLNKNISASKLSEIAHKILSEIYSHFKSLIGDIILYY